MPDLILTVNAGSSSIKFALFGADGNGLSPTLKGQVEGLGLGAATSFKISDGNGRALHDGALSGKGESTPTHVDAMAAILDWLAHADPNGKVVAVGHRIVHGGSIFSGPVIINDQILVDIASIEKFAPLHQPHNLAGIRAARTAFADIPHVGCFDTAFHQTQPELNKRFALPQSLHDAGVRRYGFHGLSYESIVNKLADAAPPSSHARLVVAHLGNGASMCAIRDGRSVATTMSFTPLDGLPMGTRCGRLDAAVVLHLLQHHKRSADEILHLLNRESGLLGLSGVSSDMRALQASAAPGARMAIDYFVEHILRELAGMVAALRGIDRLVFTGGIGENNAALRERVMIGASWLGIALDADANRAGLERISTSDSAVEVLVKQTNEEAVIAHHVAHALGSLFA
jgi:acetate kinase